MSNLTLEHFDECVTKNCFEFMRSEINCPLDEFLAKVRTLVINYLRWESGTKAKPDRKTLNNLSKAINAFLETADEDTIHGLAIEIGRLDLIDNCQYLPGHRDEKGRRNPFDGNGNVLSGDCTDDAAVLQTMLQGLRKACALTETNPVKSGAPSKIRNTFIWCLMDIAEACGYANFPAAQDVTNPFFKFIKAIFKEQDNYVVRDILTPVIKNRWL